MPHGWQERRDCKSLPAQSLIQITSANGTSLPLLKRADLLHARIHDLQDCFATLLASVVPHRILHIMLGHEYLDTTLQYYVKAERLRDLTQTANPIVIAIRQELEQTYQMAHRWT
jgi:integrase